MADSASLRSLLAELRSLPVHVDPPARAPSLDPRVVADLKHGALGLSVTVDGRQLVEPLSLRDARELRDELTDYVELVEWMGRADG